ncbi:hypothetical protein F4809DRAFT_173458 [Biscogniauxia mediterranea]|nr:hypothetical protein F4809DRAFT_173458 [Biscogniauxia mediterranea]
MITQDAGSLIPSWLCLCFREKAIHVVFFSPPFFPFLFPVPSRRVQSACLVRRPGVALEREERRGKWCVCEKTQYYRIPRGKHSRRQHRLLVGRRERGKEEVVWLWLRWSWSYTSVSGFPGSWGILKQQVGGGKENASLYELAKRGGRQEGRGQVDCFIVVGIPWWLVVGSGCFAAIYPYLLTKLSIIIGYLD